MTIPASQSSSATRRADFVWVGLMVATVVTTWILSKDMVSARMAVVATIGIAATKVRFVLLDFMELRTAPLPIRVLFEAWTSGIAVLFIAMT